MHCKYITPGILGPTSTTGLTENFPTGTISMCHLLETLAMPAVKGEAWKVVPWSHQAAHSQVWGTQHCQDPSPRQRAMVGCSSARCLPGFQLCPSAWHQGCSVKPSPSQALPRLNLDPRACPWLHRHCPADLTLTPTPRDPIQQVCGGAQNSHFIHFQSDALLLGPE